MRLGLTLSLVIHGAAAAALALLGFRAATPAPEPPLAVAIRADRMETIEPRPEEPALPEAPAAKERLELPDEAPAVQDIEAPREIGMGRCDLPRAVRLSQPLRRRAAPPPRVVTPAPAPVATVVATHAPGKLDPPRLLADRSPAARYPERARRRGLEGEVLLLLRVDTAGAVTDVEVATSSGHEELDQAAADAAALWRFEPARRDGKAIAYDVRVPVEFHLTDA